MTDDLLARASARYLVAKRVRARAEALYLSLAVRPGGHPALRRAHEDYEAAKAAEERAGDLLERTLAEVDKIAAERKAGPR